MRPHTALSVFIFLMIPDVWKIEAEEMRSFIVLNIQSDKSFISGEMRFFYTGIVMRLEISLLLD